ncbi:MAG: quinoprotein dehydrogenase-associated SoxYZ-like carrier [Rubrimonas sp.]|uniref:quinoprotein dehydrogenase-associated SoxYZ-like carrier n=1 Tax=Rubrimonas sp. TaxID=2036015 RepID=UPI002FDD63AD
MSHAALAALGFTIGLAALGAPEAGRAQSAVMGSRAGPEQSGQSWGELAEALFPGRAIAPGGEMIVIDAPYRAHDAATVPVEIDIVPPLGRVVSRFTLLVDENPAPVAAEFEVGPGIGRKVELATRLRIDAYSNVRVVAELDDGSLHQSAVFVKASGGCSAPAMKNADEAVAAVGRMKLRAFYAGAGTAAGALSEAQLMIRHPNHSGFQMDQVSLLTIPPWFVDEIEVRQGGELVLRVEGGISLSEDPSLRFRYVPNGAGAFAVRVEDTSKGVFEAVFPLSGT